VITAEVLAWQLRQYRERLHIKQEEAGKALGLDATAITKIESGKRGVSALELLQLAKLYSVPVGFLLAEETQTQRLCEHWSIAFCVIGRTIYARCMTCHLVASVELDGRDTFTTTWARTALDKVREQAGLSVKSN
jgi:DNA-binding XRE family transcriptional regulator